MRGIDRLYSWPERGTEAGNTLVVVLLVLFLLTSLGISYVAVTKGEKQIASNQAIDSEAFQHAEAGITEVLLRMSSNTNQAAPPHYGLAEPGPTYTPGWGRYVVMDPGNSGLDPNANATASDGLDNDADAAVDETSERYPETGSRNGAITPLSARLDYPWVKVRYKLNGANQILRFGDHDNNPSTPPRENLVRGVPEIILTAAGRQGAGTKIVTVEAVKWPLPPIPGSVYTEGPITFNGAAFDIDGHDHFAAAPWDTVTGAAPLAGVATTYDPTTITTTLNPSQLDNITGSGSDPSVQASNVNLDIQALADGFGQMADITLVGNQNNPVSTGWGSLGDLKIVHIAGDLSINGNMSGAGVLVIDGDFHMGGTINWEGVVICLGDVDVVGGGSAKNIVGAMLVQGSIAGNSVVNGNIKVLYSSEMLQQLNTLSKYEISSWIDQ
jgi:hypothetical protein